MNVRDLSWNVYYHNINSKKIETFNIFRHAGFVNDIERYFKKYKDKEEFAKNLRHSLMYYFWSKSEYEVVVTSWPPNIKMNELDRLNTERERGLKEYDREPYSLYVNPDVGIKVDIYSQVMNNWDVFLGYIWNSKIHRPRKENRLKSEF